MATTKEGRLRLILSNNGNYDFDVRDGHCKFVGFVNDVINCGCLGCVFCFTIKEKEKEKDTFYIKFYSKIALQSFSFSHYFSWIIIIDMCVQFIVVTFYDELITNKVL